MKAKKDNEKEIKAAAAKLKKISAENAKLEKSAIKNEEMKRKKTDTRIDNNKNPIGKIVSGKDVSTALQAVIRSDTKIGKLETPVSIPSPVTRKASLNPVGKGAEKQMLKRIAEQKDDVVGEKKVGKRRKTETTETLMSMEARNDNKSGSQNDSLRRSERKRRNSSMLIYPS